MRTSTLLLFIFFASSAFSQGKAGFLNAGLEYNFYPAGHMLGLQSELAILRNSHKEAFANPHHSVNFRLGVNIARRQDFSGLNDDESGWGPGLSLGYRYYLSKNFRSGYGGLYLGVRSDLWLLDINWKDADHMPSSGTTSITVVQPKFELGYKLQGLRLGKGYYDLLFGINNGLEINVITDGKEVGQGWITEAQFTIARNLM